MASRRILHALGGLLSLAAGLSFSISARAADLGFGPMDFGFGPAPDGPVACSIGAPPWRLTATAQTLPWSSVWLGHFAGGRPDPDFYGQIDWLDVKVCFASKASCQAWIKDLRHAYHRPEGYWTCLVLR